MTVCIMGLYGGSGLVIVAVRSMGDAARLA